MSRGRVGLFATCLVDLWRPSVGFAALELLERAGYVVEVPQAQTCCGQPAYNSGDAADAAELARRTIALFEPFDWVVAPSGSCAGMLRVHYPRLLAADPAWAERARTFAGKVHELVSFLVRVAKVARLEGRLRRRVAYHDSCSGLRELGIREEPRQLLRSLEGLELVELPGRDECCGFGGTFCVKYPEISARMVDDKAAEVEASGAELLLAGDLGCLLNIAGRLRRRGSRVEVRHVAEVLAGRLEAAPIGGEEA